MTANAPPARFAALFTPKLVTVLREGYAFDALRADALAGLTVAIVAIPLSMAIAIASGVGPERGLFTAIVGGFIVSLLGGSRFQIGGPAGAFIVLVSATVDQFGVDGLLTATLLAGAILLTIGLLRLGAFIKYIPYPVTIGFTAGIAVIIFASQIRDLLGLTLTGREPGPIIAKCWALVQALPSARPEAVAISVITIGVVLAIRRWRAGWPAFLIAVALASTLAAGAGLDVATIGSRFGGIPRSLPTPRLPDLSMTRIMALAPSALSFALLGGIESLLSAVVADSMTGRRHRSNCELAAQGVANMASAMFGGICVTGAIARTATNVRAGARGPVAGMLHAVFLLTFMMVAAPLAGFIPLSALAAVLALVAWNMAERRQMLVLIRASRGEALVLLATFGLTVFRDLTTGILVGFGLGALLFLHRMAGDISVESGIPLIGADVADHSGAGRAPYDPALATDPDIAIFRISGAFFFGTAAAVSASLERTGPRPKITIIDFSEAPMIDSTAAATIEGFARQAAKRGGSVLLCGAKAPIRRILLMQGVRPPLVRYRSTLADALATARARIERADA